MRITHIDHLVLTVRNIEVTVEFYETVLGFTRKSFGHGREALLFGQQKINLHEHGKEVEPKAWTPLPGSADLCFVTDMDLLEAMTHVQNNGVQIISGPVSRTGARGPMKSFYFRDPDFNLIEVASYGSK